MGSCFGYKITKYNTVLLEKEILCDNSSKA